MASGGARTRPDASSATFGPGGLWLSADRVLATGQVCPLPRTKSPEEESLRKYLIVALAAMLSIALPLSRSRQCRASTATVISPDQVGHEEEAQDAHPEAESSPMRRRARRRVELMCSCPDLSRAQRQGAAQVQGLDARGRQEMQVRCSKAAAALAHANIGPHSATPAPLDFKVTAYNGGTNPSALPPAASQLTDRRCDPQRGESRPERQGEPGVWRELLPEDSDRDSGKTSRTLRRASPASRTSQPRSA